jgi:hypothetical protein
LMQLLLLKQWFFESLLLLFFWLFHLVFSLAIEPCNIWSAVIIRSFFISCQDRLRINFETTILYSKGIIYYAYNYHSLFSTSSHIYI